MTRRQRGPTRSVEAANLRLLYQLSSESMSDAFDPERISATDLFDLWVGRYHRAAANVSIYWSVVNVAGRHVHEAAQPHPGSDWYGDHYLPPVDHLRRQVPLVALPLVDKHWCAQHGGDTGGFIYEATGWTPSPLQTSVRLQDLIDLRNYPGAGGCDVHSEPPTAELSR